MKITIRISLVGLLMLIAWSGNAQQLPQYSMFMNGKLLYNPGYAGVTGGIQATALGRWQWAGFKGAPNTQSLAVDTDIPNKKIGLGLNFTRDEVAITTYTNLTVNYAYRIPVGGGQLSMGLSGSVNRVKIDYSDVYVPDADANFAQQSSSSALNFGFGLYYHQSDFWLSASLPAILENKFKENGERFYQQTRHFFIAGGYRYTVNPRLRLEPNVLVKAVEGSSLAMDFNVMAWIDDRIAGGIGYRPTESVSLIVQLKVTDRLYAGYAFDYVVNSTLRNASNNSHEVMVSFRSPWKKGE